MVNMALSNAYWRKQGLMSITERYHPTASSLTNRRMRTRMSGGVRGGG